MKPTRLQLRRTKGFNLQELSKRINGLRAVKVSRPSKWGNPYGVSGNWLIPYFDDDEAIEYGEPETARREAIEGFKEYLTEKLESDPEFLKPLRGKNLACWCKLSEPCHADILLELANKKVA